MFEFSASHSLNEFFAYFFSNTLEILITKEIKSNC
jgi:hypothetical protein